MRYRNTKTGEVIEVSSVIAGGYWEPVTEDKPTAKKKPTTTAKRKKAKDE